MNEKLRAYIDSLFADAPRTRKAEELKEELYADVSAQYDDLTAEGKSEEEAYRIAVASIGDVDELVRGLRRAEPGEARRKRSAAFISAAVGLYIVSVVPPIFFGGAGAAMMFIIIAAATVLLIYNHLSQPRYRRTDDTVVEEFKEWKSGEDDTRRLYHSITAALWPLIVVLYFFLSFFFGAWAYTWLIFLIGVALQNIIKLLLEMRRGQNG